LQIKNPANERSELRVFSFESPPIRIMK